jgi:hypothetical protein
MSNNKYVYLEPQGGINDLMGSIIRAVDYCKKYNRILLINGMRTAYQINFSDYIDFHSECEIIYDINKIIDICTKSNTIYPAIFNNNIMDIINNKYQFYHTQSGWKYMDIILNFPDKNREEDIIIVRKNNGGNGFPMFKQLTINSDIIKNTCKERYALIKKPYMCIQIRNTDYKSNYELLYNNNKNDIHSFNDIYIATDDETCIDFFKLKGLSVKNFTTFPKNKSDNLHRSNINSHTKIIDLFCDIYIITMSDKLLSNSIGNFIKLVKDCREDKINFCKKFD